MGKWSVLLSLIICSSSLCFGQRQQGKTNWIHVVSQDIDEGQMRWYINSTKIVVNAKKRIIRVWVKMEIEEYDFSGLNDDPSQLKIHIGDRDIGKPADEGKKETLALHEFNCTENTSRTLRLIDYKDGKLVDDFNPHKTDYIAPDTVMEQVFNQACKKRR